MGAALDGLGLRFVATQCSEGESAIAISSGGEL